MEMKPGTVTSTVASAIVATGILAPCAAVAEDAPLSYKASPDVYKVLLENDQFRVIHQVIKPGQRDAWHSHSAMVIYRLTDCTTRLHYPDGRFTNPKAQESKRGLVNYLPPQSSHSLENLGKADCEGLIVERK